MLWGIGTAEKKSLQIVTKQSGSVWGKLFKTIGPPQENNLS